MVDSRPRVVYELVDLHRLEAEPGTRNLVRLLAGVVRGDSLESLARAVRALAERVAELGDGQLEQSLFALVRAQGSEKWPEFDWNRCENLAELVRQLEEGEMTWPEKWIEQMRPQFEERLRGELEPKVTEQLQSAVEAKLRGELEPRLAEQLQPEVEAKLAEQLQAAVEAKLAEQLQAAVEAKLAEDLRPDVEGKLRAELLPRVEKELRDELREAHREE